VTAYFDGLRRKAVDAIPFAADVRFESPLSGQIKGREAVAQFLNGVLPSISGVRVLQVISEGDCCAARAELETADGVIPVFDWFQVADGAIVALRPYYDPRPLVLAAGATRESAHR